MIDFQDLKVFAYNVLNPVDWIMGFLYKGVCQSLATKQEGWELRFEGQVYQKALLNKRLDKALKSFSKML